MQKRHFSVIGSAGKPAFGAGSLRNLTCDSLASIALATVRCDLREERSETGEQDISPSRLDQIIDMKHPLVALGRTVDWSFLEERFGHVYTDDPGRPPLPTRLMRGWLSFGLQY